ncbi:hypothetical protein EBAPG3_009515 [Nitrosospira lacus]|uniref:DUF6484 domain-containing protein n=1 Tax=Nitrosospira lacus TaxID=1288494 RepID=A0A1W6SQB1_9PROT|nr:DUF6484 domain-containing protein [Nitrosospira lacus]ARO87986.1 hypothetical protein EBAPG3_009515 [Nitrosospira lacus]
MDHTDLQSVRTLLTDVAGGAKLTGEGVSIATFAGFNGDGQFLVILSDELEPVRALSTIGFTESEVGTKIVVAFEKGNVRSPIIIGRAHERAVSVAMPNFKVDGERVVLRAEREIELRCGDASIVLTRAGKILIRGNYVLTRSRGANKIKGAFVDIN